MYDEKPHWKLMIIAMLVILPISAVGSLFVMWLGLKILSWIGAA